MNKDAAVAEAKEHLEELLQQQGINTRNLFRCLNPDHEDRNPSMGYDPKAQKAHCFSASCGVRYDTLDVIGLELGYTDLNGRDREHFLEVLREACRRFNIPLDEDSSPSFTGKPKTTQKPAQIAQKTQEGTSKEETARKRIVEARKHIEDPDSLAYLQTRGISLDTAKKYGLGFLPSLYFGSAGEGGNYKALVIPNSPSSYMARNTETSEKGLKSTKLAPQHPFNLQSVFETEVVYVVEGELNALSVIEAGGNAIALGSSSYDRKFIAELKETLVNPSKPVVCNTLVLALDNDASGMKAAQAVRKGIQELQAEGFNIKVKSADISAPYNDPNEAWMNDPENFRRAVKEGAVSTGEGYRQTSAAACLSDFLEGVSVSANTPAITTGFPLLDEALDGGLYEGLYLLPAITSGGKTTLALQLCDNIAATGQDVLYVSLEMAETELIAKSLSRHTFIQTVKQKLDRAYAKTTRGITCGRRWENYNETEHRLIAEALEDYSKYTDHVYIKEGLGDISVDQVREMVELHKEATGSAPVLFIDYVQIMAPTDPRATDKQNMDWRVWGLKAISRDYKIPVVVLSSINRMNYNESINLAALKESGALEYSSDTVIGLQLQGAGSKEAKTIRDWENERMSENPRNMELKILKNRNGKRGITLYYDYYPMFNLFYEREHPARNWTMEDD